MANRVYIYSDLHLKKHILIQGKYYFLELVCFIYLLPFLFSHILHISLVLHVSFLLSLLFFFFSLNFLVSLIPFVIQHLLSLISVSISQEKISNFIFPAKKILFGNPTGLFRHLLILNAWTQHIFQLLKCTPNRPPPLKIRLIKVVYQFYTRFIYCLL